MKALFLFLPILIASCQCGNKKKPETVRHTQSESIPQNQSFGFKYPFYVKPQIFKLKKKGTIQITTRKGVKIKIDASSLTHLDGSPVTGTPELRVSEVFDKQDFVLQNCQTVSDGQLLVSGGSVNVEAFEGDRELTLKSGSSYQMELPVLSNSKMELFTGARDELGNMNWKPIGKPLEPAQENISKAEEPVVANTDIDTSTQTNGDRSFYDIRKGSADITAEQFKSFTGVSFGEPEDDFNTITKKEIRKEKRRLRRAEKALKLYYKPVEIAKLGWINVDLFLKNRKIVKGYGIRFADGSPGTFGTYIIFKDINSMVSSVKNSVAGEQDVHITGELPEGERVKMVIYKRKEDEIWHYKLDTVITEDLIIEPRFSKAGLSDFQRIVTN